MVPPVAPAARAASITWSTSPWSTEATMRCQRQMLASSMVFPPSRSCSGRERQAAARRLMPERGRVNRMPFPGWRRRSPRTSSPLRRGISGSGARVRTTALSVSPRPSISSTSLEAVPRPKRPR